MNFISVPTVFDWWANFSSLPPKLAMVALVVTDMIEDLLLFVDIVWEQ